MNGDIDLTAATGTLAELLRRHWWLLALRGLAAVLFGILAFAWPGLTIFWLVCFFGAYALINGILSFVLAAKAPKGSGIVGLVLGGLLSVAAGLVTFFWPALTALGLLILIAWWAIFNGIMEIVSAIRLRKVIKNEWLLVLAGVASIVFGILLLLQPAVGALVLIWWIGAWALFFGVLLMALAFRMRHLGHVAVGPAHA
jgi:uncharacterized membrane protein HdeD (DUF308 family)